MKRSNSIEEVKEVTLINYSNTTPWRLSGFPTPEDFKSFEKYMNLYMATIVPPPQG
jgi:hypothetical protein